MTLSKAEQTTAITRSIATGERAPLASFNSKKYIQHDLNIGTGLRPILEFMDGLPRDRTRADVLRAFEDGDYSVVHVNYELGDWGEVAAFDVHRWEDGYIVEHWDNICPLPDKPNSSGRSIIDGPTQVSDLAQTEKNREIMHRFAETVLLTGSLHDDEQFYRNNGLVQHSTEYGDGADTYQRELSARQSDGRQRVDKIHKILGQGNTFLIMSEGTADGHPTAFYDLFRLEGGFVVEHWDVIERIPARESWKNNNGKF